MPTKQKPMAAFVVSIATLCAAGATSAVHLADDGRGQVLIYPYYTVREGNATLVSVVNPTPQGKALKVRILEARNAANVLDFNLFLPANGVWAGAISATADGAMLATTDKNCTSPTLSPAGTAFRNSQILADGDQETLQGLDRVREGYIEILEMATIPSSTALGADMTHAAGRLPKCALTDDSHTGAANGLMVPSGGLFGSATIVNFGAGYSTTLDATALDGWHAGTEAGAITGAGSATPNLASGGSTIAIVRDAGTVYVSQMATALDAVSATLMRSRVQGEYAFTSDGAFGVDWVLTMPTKREYVFNKRGSSNGGLGPFASAWSSTKGEACDEVKYSSMDREEYAVATFNEPLLPPPPPDFLCSAASVVAFGDPPYSPFNPIASAVLGAVRPLGITAIQNAGVTPVPLGGEGGWLNLQFDASTVPLRVLNAVEGLSFPTAAASTGITSRASAHTYVGLPVIGFAVSHYKGSRQAAFDASVGLRFRRSVRES